MRIRREPVAVTGYERRRKPLAPTGPGRHGGRKIREPEDRPSTTARSSSRTRKRPGHGPRRSLLALSGPRCAGMREPCDTPHGARRRRPEKSVMHRSTRSLVSRSSHRPDARSARRRDHARLRRSRRRTSRSIPIRTSRTSRTTTTATARRREPAHRLLELGRDVQQRLHRLRRRLLLAGWAYSQTTDTTTPGFGNQYSAIPGAGASSSATYGVAFTGGGGAQAATSRITFDQPVSLLGAALTNTTYAALSMRDGDAFAKKFGGASGSDPDYFTAHDHGARRARRGHGQRRVRARRLPLRATTRSTTS